VQHYFVVHGTRHESNKRVGISLTQTAQQWDHTKHIPKLVMLTDDEDSLEWIAGKIWKLT
jgi:hypothetical protein